MHNACYVNSGISWIGNIPKGWKIKRTKYCTRNISSGARIPDEQYQYSGEIPIVGAGREIGRCNISNINDPTILTGRVGTIGDFRIYNNAWATDNVLCIRVEKEDIRFICYVLNSIDYDSLVSTNAQPLITATKIGQIYLPVPNTSEQKTIADYLDCKVAIIDNTITNMEQLIEHLEQYKRALIYEVVTGKKIV